MPHKDPDKRRAYHRKWEAKHRNKMRLLWKKRYQANIGKEAARKRIYYKKNKAKINARCQAYVERNREKHRLYMAGYFQKNKKRIRKYCNANKWIQATCASRRRAAESNAILSHSDAIANWERKWRRARRVVCYWCKEPIAGKDAQLDHIIALCNGGEHSPTNVCISCGKCNNSKGGRSLSKWNSRIKEPTLEL